MTATLERPGAAVTTVLVAHPDLAASRANRRLAEALEGLPGLDLADLYAEYPDGRIDFGTERDRLLRADRLVMQFPLHWYATPPLLKTWLDEVLTPLFYSEPELAARTAGLPLMVATTTGGPSASYQSGIEGMSIDALLAPLRATARKCRWAWQPPLAVHDVRNMDDDALDAAATRYRCAVEAIPGRAETPVAM